MQRPIAVQYPRRGYRIHIGGAERDWLSAFRTPPRRRRALHAAIITLTMVSAWAGVLITS